MSCSLVFLLASLAAAQKSATAIIRPDMNAAAPGISGIVNFIESSEASDIEISIKVSGFAPNSIHGVHIHTLPVPANQNCTAAGGHFNPFNATHGAPGRDSKTRHVGDLGNVTADATGLVSVTLKDSLVSLYGLNNVTGLAFMFHQNPDDGGMGPVNSTTLATGNAGARMGCGNIVINNDYAPSTTSSTASPYITSTTTKSSSSSSAYTVPTSSVSSTTTSISTSSVSCTTTSTVAPVTTEACTSTSSVVEPITTDVIYYSSSLKMQVLSLLSLVPFALFL